jgi:hypothetical protein
MPHQSDSSSQSSLPSSNTTDSPSAVRPPARTHAQRAPDGRTHVEEEKGSMPTNREPYNSNNDYFKLLRFGVDSLYLSYQGDLFPDVQDRLIELKQFAQHPEAHQQALAQYPIARHIFEVKDKGSSVFPFVLDDGAFRIQLSKASKKLPMAYVKLSSRYLSSVTPKEAEIHLREILEELGMLTDLAHVSRIDLFADFVSNENMESWSREAWVTRGKNIAAYAVDEKFTGWAIGQGGVMSFRLYNKLLEIIESGRTDLLPLWEAAGRSPAEPVWRGEFQFRGEVLAQHGLGNLDAALANLNGLWSYAITEWLRLTTPNPDDQTRSRWPIHPLWGYLSSIDWETDGGALSRSFKATRLPETKRLLSMAASAIASYMAKNGIEEYGEGIERFLYELSGFLKDSSGSQYLSAETFLLDKVRVRAKEFNTILNRSKEDWDQLEDKRERQDLDKAAAEYLRASKGN